jgi:hypothetical protein
VKILVNLYQFQTRINTLDATARSRNNAVYMAFYFCGGALGSLLGTFSWGLFGWTDVCICGIILQIIVAIIYLWGIQRR